MTASDLQRGIRENLVQVSHQLIQVMLVGFAIGMTRTVVPAMAESEFGLERGSFLLLASFVVAFGAVNREAVVFQPGGDNRLGFRNRHGNRPFVTGTLRNVMENQPPGRDEKHAKPADEFHATPASTTVMLSLPPAWLASVTN